MARGDVSLIKILASVLPELLFCDGRGCSLKSTDLRNNRRPLCSSFPVLGLLVLIAGCHGRAGRSQDAPMNRRELADMGRAEIVEECGKQTGLHEDVFMLRDRVTFGGIGYSLDEALRLESELQSEAAGGRHPADQAACIAKFASYLESLSDPLVEADARLKELDASAFTDASKEAERQAEKKLLESDKPEDAGIPPIEQKHY
jgi:hypothetical protein